MKHGLLSARCFSTSWSSSPVSPSPPAPPTPRPRPPTGRLRLSSLSSTDSPTSDSAKSKVSVHFVVPVNISVLQSLTPPPLISRVRGVQPRISAPETSWSPPFSPQPAAKEGSRRRNRSPAARTTISTPCSSRRRPRVRSPPPTTSCRPRSRVVPVPRRRSCAELRRGRRTGEPWKWLLKPRGNIGSPFS